LLQKHLAERETLKNEIEALESLDLDLLLSGVSACETDLVG
jgi:hypothetical protein